IPASPETFKKTRSYLCPVDLRRFAGFFDIHSFWGLIGASRFAEKMKPPPMALTDTAIRKIKPVSVC
ncbi:hypothetical protein ACNBAH_004753, partial [Salmonella enterica subsp. enterica serovar Infantis]|nr:hypothetical protein [Salmonella enterica]